MGRQFSVVVVGATGLVGQTMVSVLAERKFPVGKLRLLASARSASSTVSWAGEAIAVEETKDDSFGGVEVALFSAGADASRHFSPLAARAGAIVIDNSAAFRMENWVPLVVPEVNPDDAAQHRGIIANPNCSTIQMVVAFYPIHRVNPIKRIIVDTYQSVSGTGREAVEELAAQTRLIVEGRQAEVVPAVYPHQIAFNLLPHIDVFLENGCTKEEMKMVNETRKIMHAPEIRVSATTVRVPVYFGHSEAVHIELTHPMSPQEAREILSRAPGVQVVDDPSRNVYPLAIHAAGRDDVYVGRIRQDGCFDNGLAMWVVADNVRKGAALNAVQIAELLVSRGIV